MTTLVTGGTGFIGRYVVKRLLAAGHTLRLLVPPDEPSRYHWRDQLEVVRGNLMDAPRLASLLTDVSTVVHLAGEVRQAQRFNAVNVDGTRQLLEIYAAKGSLRVVHLSSVGVIGAKWPGFYGEDSTCDPRNAYEVSKHYGEQIAMDYARRGALALTVLRPTIVFGPRMQGPPDSFLSWLRAIRAGRFWLIGSGTGASNYVFVDDVAAACVGVLDRPETVGQIYHVADPTTIRDLSEHMAHCLGMPPPGRLPAAIGYAAAVAFDFIGRMLRKAMPLTLARVRALTSGTVYSGDKLRTVLPLPVGWRAGVTQTIEEYQRAGLL